MANPSLKNEELYETLRDKGMSKEKAARISNAEANPDMHPSEKGGMVLEGEAVLRVDEQDALLRTGDSFVFDSARPHSIRNLGSVTARILWIIGAVQFDRHL